jgi:GT2 family glycosyltransferase
VGEEGAHELVGRQPFFSIIVPTYNRSGQLAACLRSLAQIDYPRDRFEVIVVDDGSASSPEWVVSKFRNQADFTLIRQVHAGPGAARNAGAARSRGQYLVFTADDCVPAPDWLRTLARRFESLPNCAVGGRILNYLWANRYSVATDLLIQYLYHYYNRDALRAQFFTPNNLAVPVEHYRVSGGFDASFTSGTGEDRDFCDRWVSQGHKMVYAPEVVVYHSHSLSLPEFCLLHFRYGRGTFGYRMKRARRASDNIHLEPISFYVNLFRYPLSNTPDSQKVTMALLLGLSQAANAAGYIWEKFRCESSKKETGRLDMLT